MANSICFLLFLSTFVTAANAITIYTYDSFSAPWGIGPKVKKRALETDGIVSQFVGFPSAGEALIQLRIEGSQTPADILIGADVTLETKLREVGKFAVVPQGLSMFRARPSGFGSKFVAFDQGYLAFVYRGNRLRFEKPISISSFPSLLKNRSVVFADPRTSVIGRGFLVWLHKVLGREGFKEFWIQMRSKVLSVTPGWSTAYGLFLSGAAEMVLSYTTSPAYHACTEPNSRPFKVVHFREGHYRQVEWAGVLSKPKLREEAWKWIGSLLSSEIQGQLPKTQWMYPVRPGVGLPQCFRAVPKVDPLAVAPEDLVPLPELVDEWVRLMVGVAP